LLALARALRDVAELTIVAPERERSAVSHAISLHDPLRAWPVAYDGGLTAWAVNGMPADCVLLGAKELLPEPPDLVVAGINRGANLGEDVWYSGTVSAAMEGSILGIASLALSVCCFDQPPDFRGAALFAAKLAPLAAAHLSPDTVLNINVPNRPPEQLRGVEVCRQGRRRYQTVFDKRTDPRGGIYYWIGTGDPQDAPLPGTDLGAIAGDRISVCPVCLDLTDTAAAAGLRDWLPAVQTPRPTV